MIMMVVLFLCFLYASTAFSYEGGCLSMGSRMGFSDGVLGREIPRVRDYEATRKDSEARINCLQICSVLEAVQARLIARGL